MEAWKAQKETEWTTINNWLNNGDPNVSVKDIAGAIPDEYILEQNYPNPFNPNTTINYSIPKSGHVTLKVYNTLGQEVATLFNGFQQVGNYSTVFEANNLASGIYMYKLTSGNVSITEKFVLMK